MTLREYVKNLNDEGLARLLVREEAYEDCVDYEVFINIEYETTDGKLFDSLEYDEAIEHQISLLNFEYEIKNMGE